MSENSPAPSSARPAANPPPQAQADDRLMHIEQRLDLYPASLWVSVSTSKLSSASTPSNLLGCDQIASMLCAKLKIDPRPGTGLNYRHRWSPIGAAAKFQQVCSASARLLDTQKLLELTLIPFGVRATPTPASNEHGCAVQLCGNFDGAQLIIQPRGNSPASAPRDLTDDDKRKTLWDLVQPLDNCCVLIHVQLKAEPHVDVQPGLALSLQSLRQTWDQHRAKKLKLPKQSTDSSADFNLSIPSRTCAVTQSSRPTDGCHIIPKGMDTNVVKQAFRVLFGQHPVTSSKVNSNPLFGSFYYFHSEMFDTMSDGSYNGMRLSPNLHRVFDYEGRLWILCGHAYILGVPGCESELVVFDPPCPSLAAQMCAHGQRSDQQEQELWLAQLEHERKVRALETSVSKDAQGALHVHALVTHFHYNMADLPATARLFKRLLDAAERLARVGDDGTEMDKPAAPEVDTTSVVSDEANSTDDDADDDDEMTDDDSSATIKDLGSVDGDSEEIQEFKQLMRFTETLALVIATAGSARIVA
ncbi:hypothetical protein OC844_000878 [Tilletia horrida]|nr:hypothetical protein OC844_000878 [Tilletia horrida]